MENNKFIRIDLVGAVIIFFVGLFLFAKFGTGIPVAVNQITTAQPMPFTVSAEGKVVAIPDTAQVSLGVQTQGNTVKAAQDSANKTINSVTAAIKNLGVADKDIKTTGYNVYPDEQMAIIEPAELPVPSMQKVVLPPTQLPMPRKVTKYRVNINLLVTVRDFAKVNDVIDAATANGANQIGGISFTVDNLEKFQSQARKVAIDKAKVKAADIAKDAGISLGKVINVTEGYSNYNPRMMTLKADGTGQGGGQSPTQIEPGSSEITVTVTISYETK